MFKILAFVIAFAAAPLALADAPVAMEAGDFAGQRATIEKGLADGKTYSEISPAARREVRDALDRMAAMLEGGHTAETLPADQKVALYNEQEIVNNILTQAAADSRVVCMREVATGSHRKVTTCVTAAERTRRRQQDQDSLNRLQRSPIQGKE